MPPKKANRRLSHTAIGKSMATADNARQRSDSSSLGCNIMVVAAAKGAHTAFSLVRTARKSNARQRKSRRAKTARKAPATKTVASGSLANVRLNTNDTHSGGESTTSVAATNDGPVR